MRKGIPVLVCIVLFCANSYAEEKMICYVPKKPVPKPPVPITPIKKEPKEKYITNENNNSRSDLYSQSTQVVINYPRDVCDNKNTFDFGRDGYEGTDGRDGIDGLDGRSGIDGLDGRKGTDGRDGSNEFDAGNDFDSTYKIKFEKSDYYFWLKYILEFIIKILSIGIWPYVLIKVVRVFSQEIKEIIPRIKELNLAGLSVKLHDLADKYKSVENNLTPEQEIKTNRDPISTIVSEWLDVETLINEIYSIKIGNSKGYDGHIPTVKLIRELRDKGILSEGDSYVLNDLRRARDRVVHESGLKFSQEDVKIYVSLANKIKASLKQKLVQVV